MTETKTKELTEEREQEIVREEMEAVFSRVLI